MAIRAFDPRDKSSQMTNAQTIVESKRFGEFSSSFDSSFRKHTDELISGIKALMQEHFESIARILENAEKVSFSQGAEVIDEVPESNVRFELPESKVRSNCSNVLQTVVTTAYDSLCPDSYEERAEFEDVVYSNEDFVDDGVPTKTVTKGLNLVTKELGAMDCVENLKKDQTTEHQQFTVELAAPLNECSKEESNLGSNSFDPNKSSLDRTFELTHVLFDLGGVSDCKYEALGNIENDLADLVMHGKLKSIIGRETYAGTSGLGLFSLVVDICGNSVSRVEISNVDATFAKIVIGQQEVSNTSLTNGKGLLEQPERLLPPPEPPPPCNAYKLPPSRVITMKLLDIVHPAAKDVRKNCFELLDKKDVVEDLGSNTHTKYLAFLRLSDEVVEMKHKLNELQTPLEISKDEHQELCRRPLMGLVREGGIRPFRSVNEDPAKYFAMLGNGGTNTSCPGELAREDDKVANLESGLGKCNSVKDTGAKASSSSNEKKSYIRW